MKKKRIKKPVTVSIKNNTKRNKIKNNIFETNQSRNYNDMYIKFKDCQLLFSLAKQEEEKSAIDMDKGKEN